MRASGMPSTSTVAGVTACAGRRRSMGVGEGIGTALWTTTHAGRKSRAGSAPAQEGDDAAQQLVVERIVPLPAPGHATAARAPLDVRDGVRGLAQTRGHGVDARLDGDEVGGDRRERLGGLV